VAAAGAVAAFALFALELSRDRRTALIAAALLSASPIFVLQNATFLAYTPTFAVAFGALGLLLRAMRTGHRWLAATSGLLAGILLFNRPYDALLFLLPPAVVFLWNGERRRQLTQQLGALALGAAPPVVLLVAYNQAVMGSPSRFAYTVHPSDAIGFGQRSSFVSEKAGPGAFKVSDAWWALQQQLGQVPRFVLGGFVVVALAGLGLAVWRLSWRSALCLSLIVAFPAGYFFWWTTWNTANYGLHQMLGPAYYLPSIGGLLVLAALGLDRLIDRHVLLGVSAVAAMAVSTAVVVGDIVDDNRGVTRVNDEVAAQLDLEGKRLVFSAMTDADYPYVRFFNQADLSGEALYARDLDAADLDLIDREADRTPYRLWVERNPDGLFEVAHARVAQLELRPVGDGLEVVVTFHGPKEGDVFAYATVDPPDDGIGDHDPTEPESIEPIDALVEGIDECADTCEARWLLTADEVSSADGRLLLDAEDGEILRFGFGVGDADEPQFAERWELRLPFGTTERTGPTVVWPPQQWRRYTFPNAVAAWTEEDLTQTMEMSLE
jgi:hypothetical protein